MKDTEKNLPLYHPSIKGVLGMIYLLHTNRYYRQLFYYRIGEKARLLNCLFPGEKTFIINALKLGEGVYVAHPYASIMNAKYIGKNLSIRQCTTIGNKCDGHNDQIPVIGDNVTIGANVVIIGDIVIGDNVIIGAGSVVVKNIPNNSVVVGNPARILYKTD